MSAQDKENQDTQGLYHSIIQDARSEAEKIIAEAERVGQARKRGGENQVNNILEEARGKAREQVEAIQKNNTSAIKVDIRRKRLSVQDKIVRETIQKAKERLREMIGGREYRRVLLGWIVEAAIGLDVDAAVVSVSEPEKHFLDRDLLAKSAERVKTLTGREVRLELSTDPPPLVQGVILTSMDGRVAFNNQVPTRILRFQSDIRKMIHDELYGRGQHE